MCAVRHHTEYEEKENLSRALIGIREVLAFIDKQIDEHEKHQKLIEIYNKVDGKSSAMLHKKMFKVRVTSSVRLLRDVVLCPWGGDIIMCCSMCFNIVQTE